jgi:hypothetical protein
MLGLASGAARARCAMVACYDRRVDRIALVGFCCPAPLRAYRRLLSEARSRANRESNHQKGGYRKHHYDALH